MIEIEDEIEKLRSRKLELASKLTQANEFEEKEKLKEEIERIEEEIKILERFISLKT